MKTHVNEASNQQLKDVVYYLQQAKKIDNSKSTQFRVALITTFTTKGLKEVLKVLCFEAGIAVEIYEAPYKQHVQQIVDPQSQLYSFNPDLIFFLGDPKTLLPRFELFLMPKNRLHSKLSLKTFFKLVDNLVLHTKAVIVISTFVEANDTVLGVTEYKYMASVRQFLRECNRIVFKRYAHSKQVQLFDINQWIAKFGWYQIHNVKQWLMGDYFLAPDYFPQLGYELMGFIKMLTGKVRKCIVLDLDNTLWGGIVGEDGIKGIALGSTPPGNAFVLFQQVLLHFYQRGILLAINSNNNSADALEVIDSHPAMLLKRQYFASIRINWQNKAFNIKEIAGELNIGLDGLVFIDDDPKKRLLVRQLVPEVLTLELPADPSLYARTILQLNDFTQFSVTEEDLSRGQKYFAQTKRKALQTEYTNLKQYFKSLKLSLKIQKATDFEVPRVAQLTQRTNQFNMTTRRYSEEDIQRFRNSPVHHVYSVEVADAFGTYGITGVIIFALHSDTVIIDTFLLSCRVLGLEIEQAILAVFGKFYKTQSISKFVGEFITTEKNKPAADFYLKSGFSQTDATHWQLDLKQKSLSVPAHITVSYEQ